MKSKSLAINIFLFNLFSTRESELLVGFSVFGRLNLIRFVDVYAIPHSNEMLGWGVLY